MYTVTCSLDKVGLIKRFKVVGQHIQSLPPKMAWVLCKHPLRRFWAGQTALASGNHLAVIIMLPIQENPNKTRCYLEDLLETYAIKKSWPIILGDLNFQFDKSDNVDVIKIQEVLTTYRLKQIVTVPTHNKNHILDWVITKNKEIIKDIQVTDKCVSDHFVIAFQLDIQKPPPKKGTVVTRSKDIDHAKLSIYLSSKVQEISIDSGCDKVEAFNTITTNIFDKHAPLKTRTVTDKPAAPWMTATIKEAKAERRRAERTWKASKLTLHSPYLPRFPPRKC
ncbi:reverse transcriptase-like protein [Elysia marginata]|uniref:Reverse transcriptase-like protein n=1 Tax=Elysia marginata TaxID=1093978 RepID=A0AAV4F5H8_9GAST|nr:reverse transcriptase-like protein [Elysia marginata]